jgi:hypothetical protein
MSDKKEHIKLKTVKLTLSEWFDALKVPSPHRNKKSTIVKRNTKERFNNFLTLKVW